MEVKSTYKYDDQERLIYKSKSENDKLIAEEKHTYSNNELIKIDKKELNGEVYDETRITIEIK